VSTALYRRYRPETFADVIGQEHVTEPLMQALRTGRVNHAYLFSGPRGCGKTTSARILARCLNCEQGPTPTPCGQCESCIALARGGPGSVDVIEIDAASHGGVDDARDLRERASYGPAQSRFKVYIIDEAHMVTPQGFNALLKIVEEPPEHVKFVFATTEPEKVIGTIRSRTHHYPFRLVPPGQLTDYMERLCEQEGVTVAAGVLSFVVRAGGGSVRDSLSVLDQLIAGSGDEGLTYDSAAALLGFTDAELLDAIIDAFAAGDAAGVFHQVDRVVETGLDPRRFVEDLLERLRDRIVVAAVPDGASSVLRLVPQDQVERMRQQAGAFGAGALSRAADIVNAGLTEMTGATAPRLQLELICARVLLPGASGESGYAARLDRLERRLDVEGVPSGTRGVTRPEAAGPPPPQAATPPLEAARPAPDAARPAPAPAPRATPARAVPESPAPRAERQAAPQPADAQESGAQESGAQEPARRAATADQTAGPARVGIPEPASPPQEEAPREETGPPVPRGTGGLDTAAIRRAWPDVLGKVFSLKRPTWTLLSEHAQVLDYDGQRLLLGISTVGLANTFRRGPHAELVRQALIDVLGVDARVEGVPTPDAVGSAPSGGPHPSVTPDNGPGASDEPDDTAAVDGARRGMPGRGPAPSQGPTGGPPMPESGAGGWASVASAAGSGPSWASEAGYPAGAAEPAGAGEPTTGRRASGALARSRLERAREEMAADGPGRPSEPRVADDSAASADDEDVEALGEVGRPVVERILGGTVIDEGP
jgi:DNA polymerase-3 subunit gamma/tau